MSENWIALGSIVASALFWSGAAYAALRSARKDLNGVGRKLRVLEEQVARQRYVLTIILLANQREDQRFGPDYWETMLRTLEER